jgi:MerR family transcriptional regulator/heat shock protein HspR
MIRESGSEPRFVISVAAKILGIQTHTLRYYEKIGIIEPSRSRGNIRLYSEKDLEQLRRMKTLIEDLGVNLAGAEVILRMAEHIAKLQHRLAELEAELEERKSEEQG